MGEDTATESAPDAATTRDHATARATVLGWARRTVDLIPTSWLLSGAGAVLLATTAAFGGLATAPAQPIPELAVGEVYVGSDFEIIVVGVELWSDQGHSAFYPDKEKEEKVLVVLADVVNTFGKPRATTALADPSPSIDGIRLEGMPDRPTITRADDGTGSTQLQPDVPARLLLAWRVGPDEVHDGDEVTLTLPTGTHRVGASIKKGEDYWDDVRVGAVVTTTIEEAVAR